MAAPGLVAADWPEVALWSVAAALPAAELVAFWSLELGGVAADPLALASLVLGG